MAMFLTRLCRRYPPSQRAIRYLLATTLAGEELFRYAHDGIHFPGKLPIHLCTIALWMAVVACFTLAESAVEFSYFVGLPGSAVALLTPDLHAAWNSYDFIRYFFEHGCLLITVIVLVLGKIAPLRAGAAFRAHNMWFGYAVFLMLFNWAFGTNYLYLRHKPTNPTPLDYMGPWPVYILVVEATAIALFWLLWQPVKPKSDGAVPGALQRESVVTPESL
jgi:hypothetical integral membrane protein (TIGR02206 family)